jgi:hypothetical protein
MHQMTEVARRRGHLSRHERQRIDRAAALSRRTSDSSTPACSVNLTTAELELVDRLVRSDRTAVSTALLAIAGIGAGEARRLAVLDWIGAAADLAVAEGAISSRRADQIARHIARAIGLACALRPDHPGAPRDPSRLRRALGISLGTHGVAEATGEADRESLT